MLDIFFTIGFVGIGVLVLGCGMFLGLTREPRPAAEPARAMRRVEAQPSEFFTGDTRPVVVSAANAASVGLLLGMVERHVRQEQAAVEGFLRSPTVGRLKSNTTSPLVN
jgi:hypothetical protein